MKRGVCVFLIVLLATAAGCGQAQPRTVTGSPADDHSSAFQLDTLPEIGGFVSDEKKAFFFEDGAHNEFEPREDYGGIVPYIEKERMFKTRVNPVFGSEEGYVTAFGLMTTDGRIITKGLWDHFSCAFAPDGSGYYAFTVQSAADDSGNGIKTAADAVGADGSWGIHFAFGEHIDLSYWDAPYFGIKTAEELRFYDFGGNPRSTLPFQKLSETEGYTNVTVLRADAESVTVLVNTIWYNDAAENSGMVYTLDWNGIIRYGFPVKCDVKGTDGKILTVIKSFETGHSPVGLDGTAKDGVLYKKILYSKADRLYLTLREKDGRMIAEYRDENWQPTTPKNVGWTEKLLPEYETFRTAQGKERCFITDWNETLALDFFGNPILPEGVKKNDTIRLLTDPETDGVYITARSKQGRETLFGENGAPLAGTPAEENVIFSAVNNGIYVYITEDRDLYACTVASGRADCLHPAFTERIDQDEMNYVYIRGADENMILLTAFIEDDGTEFGSVQRSFAILRDEEKPKVMKLRTFEEANGFRLLKTDTHAFVFAPDGTLLLKLHNTDGV